MNRFCLAFLYIIFLTAKTYSTTFGNNIGIIPVGVGITKNNTSISDFSIIHLEVPDGFCLGLGVGIDGVKFNYIDKDYKKTYISVMNPTIFWNFYPYEKSLIIGPFASINYAPNFYIEDFIAFTGLRFAFSPYAIDKLFFSLHLEGGYKYIHIPDKKNANGFYANARIDIAGILLYSIFWIIANVME